LGHVKNDKKNRMRSINLISIICIILSFSCSHDDEIKINEDLLPGAWRLEKVTFNEVDGTAINDWISTFSNLIIREDKFYYHDYVSGEWSVKGNKLMLTPQAGIVGFDREYEILKLTDKTIVVKFKRTDLQYCCDLEQFRDDEILTIIETYRKDN
jgi:hypothetical protein